MQVRRCSSITPYVVQGTHTYQGLLQPEASAEGPALASPHPEAIRRMVCCASQLGLPVCNGILRGRHLPRRGNGSYIHRDHAPGLNIQEDALQVLYMSPCYQGKAPLDR